MVQQCRTCGGLGCMCDGSMTMGIYGMENYKPATQCISCQGKGVVESRPLTDQEYLQLLKDMATARGE